MQIEKINIVNNKSYNTSFQARHSKVLANSKEKILEKSLAVAAALGLSSILLSKNNSDNFIKEIKGNYSDDEFLIIKKAYRKNPELTKYLLKNSMMDDNRRRFRPTFLANKEIFEVDPEFVKLLVEMKNLKTDNFRFRKGSDIISILNNYKLNPERTLELIEEKHVEPYEDLYVYESAQDINAVLEAEMINKNLAKKFENIRLLNGVKRFEGSDILRMTENYPMHSKAIEALISAKLENGTPLLTGIPKEPTAALKLIKAFEKCPNIADFMNESFEQFQYGTNVIETFADAYEKDPNYTVELFRKKDFNNEPRYSIREIYNLIDARSINKDLFEELLKIQDSQKEKFLGSDTILALVKLQKENPEIYNEIISQKHSNGDLRICSPDKIKQYMNLKDLYKDNFIELYNEKDGEGNFIYSEGDLEVLFECYKKYDKKEVDYLFNLKDSKGIKKLGRGDISRFMSIIERYPEYKEVFFSLLSESFVDFKIIAYLQSYIPKRDGSYERIYEKLSKINKFLKERNISADPAWTYGLDLDGEILLYSSDNSMVYVFDKNGDLKTIRENNNAESVLYEEKVSSYNEGKVTNSMNFTNYYETNGYWKYPMEFVKNVYDPADNKKTYSAYTEKSKDYPDKLNLYQQKDGELRALSETKKDSNGDLISQKNIEYLDTKLTQDYRENPKSRKNSIKIVDKQGNVLLNHNIRFNVLSKDKFESIENGIKYTMEYFPDKVVVSKDGEAPIEIAIGENSVDAEEVISKDLLYLVKQLPGSTLYNLHKYKVLKIWQNENKISKNNAQFNGFVNKIELSEYQSREEKLFVLLHEIGHFLDYHKLRADEELSKIFNEEKEIFKNNSTANEQTALSYLIDSRTITNNSISTEAVAETYAILNSINKSPELELRGLLFQQYFPRTFAKIAELLND